MVTKTLLFGADGSGLFSAGPGAGGKMFRAIDKKTGAIIHEMALPASTTGIPMTYMVDDRQYIVVAIGGARRPRRARRPGRAVAAFRSPLEGAAMRGRRFAVVSLVALSLVATVPVVAQRVARADRLPRPRVTPHCRRSHTRVSRCRTGCA